ncbi:MAG: hypothetical protein AAF384_18810 [Pseudomonadota bacterium]
MADSGQPVSDDLFFSWVFRHREGSNFPTSIKEIFLPLTAAIPTAWIAYEKSGSIRARIDPRRDEMSKCSEPTLRVLARIVFTLSIAFDAAAAYDSQRDAALQWLEEQQLNDGAWGASGLKFRATSLTADAMRASGWMHNSYFAALTWLANHAGANNDDELRRALALYRHGADITALTNRITSEQQPGAPGRDGWGLSALYRQATLDTGVVLRALAEIPNSANHQSAINFLKSSQLSSGAWPSVAGGPAFRAARIYHKILGNARYMPATQKNSLASQKNFTKNAYHAARGEAVPTIVHKKKKSQSLPKTKQQNKKNITKINVREKF